MPFVTKPNISAYEDEREDIYRYNVDGRVGVWREGRSTFARTNEVRMRVMYRLTNSLSNGECSSDC